MTKCTFCNHRLRDLQDPACASLCPTGALKFGDLDKTIGVTAVAGFPKTEIEPLIRFIPLRRQASPPEQSAFASIDPATIPLGKRKDSGGTGTPLRSEWPLAIFTLLAAVLVAAFTSCLVSDLSIDALGFAGVALAGLGLSTFHLGRRSRAWRAVINVRKSWLSREIFGYLLFVVLSVVALLNAPVAGVFGWAVAVIGFGALHSIDRVYDVTTKEIPTSLHSAGCVLTGMFLTMVFSGYRVASALLGLIKFALYILRKIRGCSNDRLKIPLAVLRIGIGLIAPAAIWIFQDSGAHALVVGFVFVGEIVDRLEYYREMGLISPQTQIDADFEELLTAQRRDAPAI
jgi:DMSO reductase anchor subunit